MHLSKPKNSFSSASESFVDVNELLLPFGGEGDRFTPNINVLAPIPYLFGSTFQENTVLRI